MGSSSSNPINNVNEEKSMFTNVMNSVNIYVNPKIKYLTNIPENEYLNIVTIDLSHCKLLDIPEKIFLFQNLEILNLSTNQITNINNNSKTN